MRFAHKYYFVTAAVTTALLAGVVSFVQLQKPHAPKHLNDLNIVWITADSMRAHHLGAYGYNKPTSPNIDAFANTGTLFTNAYNPSGWTGENMVSVLTGVYSPLHGVNTREKKVPGNWYLPLEKLHDYGFRVPYMQGFQQDTNYQQLGFEGKIESIDAPVWLAKNKDKRFFLWIHLLQTHLPYNAPEPYLGRFWRDDLIVSEESKARLDIARKNIIVARGSVEFNKEQDLPALQAMYDADVNYMDHEFGSILNALNKLGLRKNTLVIFSADHGEELLDHGFIGHASTARGGHLHDEIMHVPMIISLPGVVPENKIIDTQVRGIDLMPTIFELLGLKPEAYFQGESLLPIIQLSDSAADRTVYNASSHQGYQEIDPKHVTNLMYAVRHRDWKLIRKENKAKEKTLQLFNLIDDPGETKDVSHDHPEQVSALEKELDDWLAKTKNTIVTKEANPFEAFTKLLRHKKNVQTDFPVPNINIPAEGETFTFDSTAGKVRITWDGAPDADYLVEVQLGDGDAQFTTQVEVTGLELEREFSKQYWEEYVKRYNPARFRVKVDGDGHQWSPWRTVSVK